eukprot:6788815-Alexandrium_andersonii.AAC.1
MWPRRALQAGTPCAPAENRTSSPPLLRPLSRKPRKRHGRGFRDRPLLYQGRRCPSSAPRGGAGG